MYETLLTRLRGLRVETGSLPCLGCGCEYGCSIHGCAYPDDSAVSALHITKACTNAAPRTEITIEEAENV